MFLLLSLLTASAQLLPSSPTVGVLSVPGGLGCDTFHREIRTDGGGAGSCFASVYIKWIESAGAKAVVIPYDSSHETIDKLLSSVNGVLFTGGEESLFMNTTFYQTALYIYNKVIEINTQQNIYLPLWGTCMGFQLLCILTANNESVLERNAFDSEDYSIPLNFTSYGFQSRMFVDSATDIRDILTQQNVTSNLHHDGVSPGTFMRNAKLSSFFDVISVDNDRQAKSFVSSIEAQRIPIYGVQWHPERPQYEWTPKLNLNHSPDAVTAMQYMANFFISETRKNNNSFSSAEYLRKFSIYSFNTVATMNVLDGYQVYMFPRLH